MYIYLINIYPGIILKMFLTFFISKQIIEGLSQKVMFFSSLRFYILMKFKEPIKFKFIFIIQYFFRCFCCRKNTFHFFQNFFLYFKFFYLLDLQFTLVNRLNLVTINEVFVCQGFFRSVVFCSLQNIPYVIKFAFKN